MRNTLLILLMLINTPLFADYPLEIIELKGRSVTEVLPLIRPFIDSDGSVSGMNNQLILRTSPDNLRNIYAILNRIDTPPRRLLISVRQGRHDSGQADGISADINAFIGRKSKVIVGHPSGNEGVRLRGLNADTRDNSNLVSSIQTIAGRPAFITAGQSIPITTYRSYGDGDYRHFQRNTQYRNATSGFYALPRLNGQRVTIDISPHMEHPGRTPESFDIMRASSRVSGLLGEWISLGGTTHSESRQGSGIGFSASSRQKQANSIWLKVEEIR